jgi:polyisoprenoid-binding protein YceI
MPVLAALALLLASQDAAVLAAQTPATFAVRPGSTLSYRAVHPLHTVNGVTHEVEGRARVLADGGVQVMIRAPVSSFDSGNGNRDAHMREVTESAQFPFVVLKAVGSGVVPAGSPAAPLRLSGELTFHGVTQRVEVPATVQWQGPDRATVDATFPISLGAYHVERPALFFSKIEDRVDVTAKLVLEREP